MPQAPVNIGVLPNDGSGDNLRVAFSKLNANDADLDGRIQALTTLVNATMQTPAGQKALLTSIVAALPTALPAQSGQLWLNGKTVQIS